MKRRLVRLTAAFACLTAGLVATGAALPANAADDGMPDQSSLDSTQNSMTQGNWSDLSGGVAGRPYVKALSITTGGTTTELVANGTATTAAPTAAGSVTAVIAPFNLCKTGTTGNNCYASPNRVGITLGYTKSQGQAGYNFSNPTVPLIPTVTTESVIDLTIALNTVGKNLGWTWMNGTPSYWKTENLGQDTATARVKFSLSKIPTLPSGNDGCTRIPVETCDAAKSLTDDLGGSLVLSLDTTLSSTFAGALFATNDAVIGSLEAVPGGGDKTATLTYGIAAPHTMNDGTTVRKGKFFGFLSDAVLESQFKVTATETDMTKVMSVARTAASKSTSDAGTDTVTWTKWTAADNGTDGRLVTISDVSFSAPKFVVTKVSSGGTTTGAPSTGSASGAAPKAPTKATIVAKARLITLSAAGVKGVTYKALGTLGATKKAGTCKLAGTKLKCTVRATKAGTWRVTVTPSQAGVIGATLSKTVKVK